MSNIEIWTRVQEIEKKIWYRQLKGRLTKHDWKVIKRLEKKKNSLEGAAALNH